MTKNLRLAGRITKNNKTVGYVVQSLNGHGKRECTVEQATQLVADGKIQNAKIASGKITGDGEDLRKLPKKSLDVKGKGIKFMGGITVIKTTDMDSDLQDAPYRTDDGRVYLMQKEITLICDNSEIRENLMVRINDATRLSEYSDVGIQTFDVVPLENGKEKITIKLLHYKMSNILLFIGMLQVMTKVKFEDSKRLLFIRTGNVVYEFSVDFRRRKIGKSEYKNVSIAEEETRLLNGLFVEFNKYIK